MGLPDTMLLYVPAVLALVAGMVILSHLLGERHRSRDTEREYESGMIAFGSTRAHLWVPFYLLAVLFVSFDLEVVFLFSWAVAFRELGWTGFWGALVFIGVLAVALVYEWRQGTFDWGPKAKGATSDTTQFSSEGGTSRNGTDLMSGAETGR